MENDHGYLFNLFDLAWESAGMGVVMIDLLIAFLVVCVVRVLENRNLLPKILLPITKHAFIEDDKLRLVVTFVTIFILHIIFIAPYYLYKKNKMEISILTIEIQKQKAAKTDSIPVSVTVTNITVSQVSDTNVDAVQRDLQKTKGIWLKRKIVESFNTSDSGRVTIFAPTNKAPTIFFILKHAPINNSIDVIMQSPMQQSSIFINGIDTNVVWCIFDNTNQIEQSTFFIKYVPEDVDVSPIKTVRNWSGGLLFDSSWTVITNSDE